MRNRVIMQCCAVALCLLAPPARGQRPGDELRAIDLAALLDAGVPSSEVVALAEEKGVASRWSEDIARGLVARGASADDVRRLEHSASRAVPSGGTTVQFDGAAGVTWSIPLGWTAGERDGEFVISLAEATPSITAEVRARALVVDAAELRSRGIDTLNAYHHLRVAEILAGEGTTWTHHGTWSLPAVGWTGIHSVFEESDGAIRRTMCLTWFARGDRLLSMSSRIREPLGNPTHDDVVDDVTAILTGHAPRAFGAIAMARHTRASAAERVVLADGDGRIVALDRRARKNERLLPPGHDRVGAASAGFLLTTRGGLVEHHRRVRDEWSDPAPLHRVDGPVLAIAADPLGDGFSVLTRTLGGTPTRRLFDMRGETREIATDDAGARIEGGAVIVGEISMLVPGAAELRCRRDDDGLLVAVSCVTSDSSRLVLFGDDGSGLRELARLPAGTEDDTAIAILRGACGEILIVAPGAGLCSIPRDGGLPVVLIEPGSIRDACLIP